MVVKRALEWLGGSVVVYAAVVACGSSSNGPQPIATAGMTGDSGAPHGGMPGASGASSGEPGSAGVVVDPTPDASAAGSSAGGDSMCDCPDPDPYVPPEPLVIEAECDQLIEAGLVDPYFAVIPKPNLPQSSIDLGVGVLTWEDDISERSSVGAPPGFRTQTTPIVVSDTSVAAYCGAVSSSTDEKASVRFVFPR